MLTRNLFQRFYLKKIYTFTLQKMNKLIKNDSKVNVSKDFFISNE